MYLNLLLPWIVKYKLIFFLSIFNLFLLFITNSAAVAVVVARNAYTFLLTICFRFRQFSFCVLCWIFIIRTSQKLKKKTQTKPSFWRDHYFTSATWISTTELSVVWLNRPQNISVVTICKSPLWICQEVCIVENDESWIHFFRVFFSVATHLTAYCGNEKRAKSQALY